MLEMRQALTFDDVLLVPGYSEVLPRDTGLSSRLTRTIDLNIPFVSSAMDTVTEARLAIGIAQAGGIGIIHKNMAAEEQARQVRAVKKFESGVIADPVTVSPRTSIREVLEITREHDISGVPVVDGTELAGIVTNRDLRFETHHDAPVTSVMTPKDKLVTVREGTSQGEIRRLLHTHRIEKVLVVNEDFELRGLVTVKDIRKAHEYPEACKDEHEQLRVGAAVSTGQGTDERVEALIAAGVDVIVVDTAHGHSQGVVNRVRSIKQRWPDMQVIGGNVATADGAQALVQAGCDAVKVGIGPGSICTTRVVAGVGVPQLSAIDEGEPGHSREPGTGHRRRRYPLFGRRRQGRRRRRARGHGRQPVRGYRGVARRGRALPGAFVQVLPRDGGRSARWAGAKVRGTATSRTR